MLIKHIDQLYNTCGSGTVCLGTDFDGTSDDTLPYGIENVGKVGVLYDAFGMRYMFFSFGTVFVLFSFVTMLFVKHGDSKPQAKKA